MHLRVRLGPHGQVPLSYEHRNELGGGVRIRLAGSINGSPFRTTSFRLGDFTGIAFRNDLLRELGVAEGDEIELELHRDTGPPAG